MPNVSIATRNGHPKTLDAAAEILTIREVAGYLKLPVSTVYRLAERRDLPGRHGPDRHGVAGAAWEDDPGAD